MVNHPVYQDKERNKFRNSYLELVNLHGKDEAQKLIVDKITGGDLMKRIMFESHGNAFFNALDIEGEIIKHGHILINVDKNDWNSDISEKTLESLDISFFNFPFPAGTVKIDNLLVNFSAKKDFLIVSFHDAQGEYSLELSDGDIIGEVMSHWAEENREIMFSVLSILLYISTYKKDKRRVSNKEGEKSQGSNKKSIPKHKIHHIALKQYTTNTRNSIGGGGKSNKTWLVRGHWRNVAYGKREEGLRKPVWVDAFWKGSGKEMVQKTYKI